MDIFKLMNFRCSFHIVARQSHCMNALKCHLEMKFLYFNVPKNPTSHGVPFGIEFRLKKIILFLIAMRMLF